MADDTALPPHLDALRHLLDHIQGVVFQVPDDTGLVSLESDLVAMVQDAMERTIDLLGKVAQYYDPEEPDPKAAADLDGVDLLSDIGALISTELAGREVADLAWVARGQLKGIEVALAAALDKGRIWAVASHADTGLRRAGKALVAVESAICEYEGLNIPERQWVEIGLSLKIRTLYGRFRRAVVRLDAADLALRERLEGAAGCIVELRRLEIYPFLRIEDRVAIRGLQKRIAGALQSSSAQEGNRVWQDTTSLAQLLVNVNQRAELRHHDILALRGLCFRLESSAEEVAMDAAELREALAPLEGRDDVLDDVIEAQRMNSAVSHETLWAVLHRLLNELKPAEAGSSPSDTLSG